MDAARSGGQSPRRQCAEHGRPGMTVAGPTPALQYRCASSRSRAPAWRCMLDGVPVAAARRPGAGRPGARRRHHRGPGQRTYLAVRGGFERAGRSRLARRLRPRRLRRPRDRRAEAGDVLHLSRRRQAAAAARPGACPSSRTTGRSGSSTARTARPISSSRPTSTTLHGAYEVHFNSARTGVRLIGPTPRWARPDGGEAGLHPSNLHDNAYAIGAIDFTGDMPIILGPDGPSLGGFVCPAVIARDDNGRSGQLRPGDSVRFAPAARPRDPVAGPARRSVPAHRAELGHRRARATTGRSRSSTAARATTTCWSSTAR